MISDYGSPTITHFLGHSLDPTSKLTWLRCSLEMGPSMAASAPPKRSVHRNREKPFTNHGKSCGWLSVSPWKKCQTCQTKSIVIWSWEKICHHGDLIPITPIFNSFIPYYIDHGFWKGFDIRGQILSTLSPINRDNSERFRKLHSNGPANAISEI